MSTQAYASGGHPAGNKIIGELVKPAPDGGISVSSLTITSTPGATTNSAGYLVRDPDTGLVMTQAASSVPDTGFTLRTMAAAGQSIPAATDTVVLFADEAVGDAGVTYAAGVFTLVYSGVYTASYSGFWTVGEQGSPSAALYDLDLVMWCTLLSQGAQKLGASGAVTHQYNDAFTLQGASFSFIAEAGDELRVHTTQNDTIAHTLGAGAAPNLSSITITRISPFVPPV